MPENENEASSSPEYTTPLVMRVGSLKCGAGDEGEMGDVSADHTKIIVTPIGGCYPVGSVSVGCEPGGGTGSRW
jgi:hypothetical protein